jgi:hypothetical protein
MDKNKGTAYLVSIRKIKIELMGFLVCKKIIIITASELAKG